MRPFLVGIFVALALCSRLIFDVNGDIVAFLVLLLAVSGYGFYILRDLVHGHLSINIVGFFAMLGGLLLGEWWAGLVVLVVLAMSQWLEAYAFRHAQREFTTFLGHAPTVAHVKVGSHLKEVGVDALLPGQLIVIRPGEVVPTDAIVTAGRSSLDTSYITGEALPVEVGLTDKILAGSLNQTGSLEARVLTLAQNSQYSRMRALTTERQQEKVLAICLAENWSRWYVLIVLVVAGLAWAIFKDPVRSLAVLVVATPYSLLRVAPVSLLAGMNGAFKAGIIIKRAEALEMLAHTQTFLFDKTGILALSEPRIRRVFGYGRSAEEVLHLAASLGQISSHILGKVLVLYARSKHVSLVFPKKFHDKVGQGVVGEINGDTYVFGQLSFLKTRGIIIPQHVEEMHVAQQARGEQVVYLARGSWLIGSIVFADILKSSVSAFLGRLRTLRVECKALLTDDETGSAQKLASRLGIKHVHAECLLSDKVDRVHIWQEHAASVAMIGDGVNDVSTLAQADIGIIMGMQGEGAFSKDMDVVFVNEKVEQLEHLIQISRRTSTIAKTATFLGVSGSSCLLLLALQGFISPLLGAWLQGGVGVVLTAYSLQAKKDRYIPVSCQKRKR